jgi:hypothetical protein
VGAGRFGICVTHLMGAERPTAVQYGGMGVFERSNDHAVGSERSLRAGREDSACLNWRSGQAECARAEGRSVAVECVGITSTPVFSQ